MRKVLFLLVAIVSVVGMIAISGCNRPETYTVTFNSNGGAGTMADQTFTEDEAQALTPNTFTYEGHTFASWNTVQDGSGTSYTDGQAITATADMTLYAQWTAVPQRHEYVDLGLPSGTLWATCNVGANAPEESGDYFAWGETAPKEEYTEENYIYYGGVHDNGHWNGIWYTKYNTEDNLLTLLPTDDAATVNWGNGWRMPTETEYRELCSNCTLTLATINGVDGVRYTGTNGNFIFLPSICVYTDERSCNDGNHLYWTSTRYPNYDGATFHYVDFYGEEYCGGCEHDGRRVGAPVRPVVAQ